MSKQFVFMRDFEIAYLRWQLLRRNDRYVAAYKKFAAEHPGFAEIIVGMGVELRERALRDEEAFGSRWGCPPADPQTVICPFHEVWVDPDAIIPSYSEKTGNLQFNIPIRMPSKAILRWVTYWVSHFKRNEGKDREAVRKRLPDIKLALKVYDLKKQGLKYTEIVDKLDLDPKYLGTGYDRAKNLFNTAKTWIKRAEMKTLWVDGSWMFDSIIDRHQRGQLPDPLS